MSHVPVMLLVSYIDVAYICILYEDIYGGGETAPAGFPAVSNEYAASEEGGNEKEY